MPELPEVELFKQYFDSTSLHKNIEKVQVKSPTILRNISTQELDKLKNHEFQSTQRYGKYLLAKTDDDFLLTLHFGMTGKLKYFKDIKDEPAHSRLLITFTNGFHLSFDNQRKFGEVYLTKSLKDFIEEKNLGPDVLDLDFKTLKKIVDKRRGSIKYTLMNQHIIAGVGNIYSDEIAFQTGVNPTTKINRLNEETLRRIFEEMQKVLKTSVDSQANFERLPDNYLIPHRYKGGKCPKGDSKLERIKISGRTSYYCPKHQKKLD